MTGPEKSGRRPTAERRRINPAVGFGTSFAGGMAVFALLGHLLDVKTGRERLFTLIGIGLGLLYGAWELWKLATLSHQERMDEDPTGNENEPEQQHEPHA